MSYFNYFFRKYGDISIGKILFFRTFVGMGKAEHLLEA